MRTSFASRVLTGFAGAAAIAALGLSASPAEATVFSILWSGTLDTGSYTLNSDPAVDLTGKTFQILYSVDTSIGDDFPNPPTDTLHVNGVSAWVTIEGLAPFAIAGNFSSSTQRINNEPGVDYDRINYYITDSSSDPGHFHFAHVDSTADDFGTALVGTLFDSIAYDALPIRPFAPTDHVSTFIQYNDILTDPLTGETTQLFIETSSSNGTITAPGGTVPEPASWAMMIAGIGAVGMAMRRARKAKVAFS